MSDVATTKRYEALPVPDEAAAQGGVELLRVAVSDDELFILARPALKDPSEWGEILGEITRRLGRLYAMSDTGFDEHDVIVAIEEAYAAEMGAKSVGPEAKRTPRKPKPIARKAPRKAPKKVRRKIAKPRKRKKR